MHRSGGKRGGGLPLPLSCPCLLPPAPDPIPYLLPPALLPLPLCRLARVIRTPRASAPASFCLPPVNCLAVQSMRVIQCLPTGVAHATQTAPLPLLLLTAADCLSPLLLLLLTASCCC